MRKTLSKIMISGFLSAMLIGFILGTTQYVKAADFNENVYSDVQIVKENGDYEPSSYVCLFR